MVVTVKYFALIRESTGRRDERWDVPAGTAALDLFEQVVARYRISLNPADTLLAINDTYASLDRVLVDGDEIVFMPPLAGG